MSLHRRAHTAALAIAALFGAAACNLIVGAHERSVDLDDVPTNDRTPLHDNTPSGSTMLDPSVVPQPADEVDGGVPDAGNAPVRIAVSGPWATPNRATFEADGAGVKITAFAEDATHPIVVPAQQPAIPANDYTVHGVVRAPTAGEFGILARVQADGSGLLLSARFGGVSYPWIGVIGPPIWDPSKKAQGLEFVHADARYRFKLRLAEGVAYGKLWVATDPEPFSYQVAAPSPFPTGAGVGYYTYDVVPGAVLESLEVTVP